MSLCIGLTIGFTTTSVSVEEGDIARLCASVLNGDIGRTVDVQFATQPDTAEG